jgi:hypothetical protein
MTTSGGRNTSTTAKQPSRQVMWAVLICLLGFSLLLYQLDRKSLWGDETFRVHTTDVALGDLPEFLARVKMHVLPPLYPSCLWVWRSFAGDTEFALRFPSVVFAMLGLAMIYRLGTSAMGHQVGLVALALAAVSPFLILSARMVQYYSLLLLLSATSSWLFLQLLQGPGTRTKWVAYMLISAMATYTQYFAAFVLATHGLIALTQVRKRRNFVLKFLVAQAVVVLLFAPAVSVIVAQSVGRFAGEDAFGTSSVIMSAFALVYPFFAWTVGGSIFPWNPLGLLGALLGLYLAARGLWAMVKAEDAKQATRALAEATAEGTSPTAALAYAAFILLPLCLSVFAIRGVRGASGDPFVANRAVFCVPVFYLLIAAGTVTIDRPALRSTIIVTMTVVFGLSLFNYYHGREFHNPLYVLQTEDLAGIVHRQAQPEDVFVSDEMTTFGYYIRRTDPHAVHFHATASEQAGEYIAKEEPENVWLVLICRAVETESSANLVLLPWLPEQGYQEQLSFGYSPQDETMARVQELVLRRPACRHKIVVTRYTRVQ